MFLHFSSGLLPYDIREHNRWKAGVDTSMIIDCLNVNANEGMNWMARRKGLLPGV